MLQELFEIILYVKSGKLENSSFSVNNGKISLLEIVLAPRPGFGPGSGHGNLVVSCGRQPHILDRTILPGLTVSGLERRINTR